MPNLTSVSLFRIQTKLTKYDSLGNNVPMARDVELRERARLIVPCYLVMNMNMNKNMNWGCMYFILYL